jgi:hypothetical protein
MASFELVKAELDIIVKNVKINKIIFMKIYTPKIWLHLVEKCHENNREDRKEFILCLYCNCKKNTKMKLNEHKKKGCEKAMDDHGNQLTLKLYPPLKNVIKATSLQRVGMFWNIGQSWKHYQNQSVITLLL